MVSSLRDRPLPQDLVVFGEVGLAGNSPGTERSGAYLRSGEARLPPRHRPGGQCAEKVPEGMQIFGVKKLSDALSVFDDL